MGADAQPILRVPLILLAVANLAILGLRLWPWPDVLNLPGNGATGIDPAVTLLGYIGLVFWIANSRREPARKALTAAMMLGLGAGLLLVAQVLLGFQPAFQVGYLRPGLLCAAAILWGIAGLRGAQAAANPATGLLCGAWSAMASCLMACTAVLAVNYFAGTTTFTTDPWKQYEGLAIGDPVTQALVHSLNTVMGFLLIGPLAGSTLGLLFAWLGLRKKA